MGGSNTKLIEEVQGEISRNRQTFNGSNVKDLFNESDLRYLSNFMSLATVQSNSWQSADPTKELPDWIQTSQYSQKDKIVTEYLPYEFSTNNVPISRSTMWLDYNVDARLYFNLLNDKSILSRFCGASDCATVREFNPLKRISQYQVFSNHGCASHRDYIVNEMAFCIKPDNSLVHYKDLQGKYYNFNDKYPNNKLVYILPSLTMNDSENSKYYKDPKSKHVRATMFRSGLCIENFSNGKAKLTAIMEYGIGGSIEGHNQSDVYANATSYNTCHNGKQIFSIAKRQTPHYYQK